MSLIFNNRSRRVELAVTIGGHDATSWLLPSLLDFEYTDNAGGKADEIQITLHDRESSWNGKWKPAKGTEVTAAITVLDWFETSVRSRAASDVGRASSADAASSLKGSQLLAPAGDFKEHAELPCGSFKIDEIKFFGPPDKVRIKAVSASLTDGLRDEKRTRAWEGYHLQGIASEIASREGLELMYSGPEHSFSRRDQREESDIAFIQRLGTDAGMNVKAHNGKLIMFDSEEADNKESTLTITRSGGQFSPTSYSFKEKSSGTAYSACEVVYKDPASGKTLQYSSAVTEEPTAVASGSEPSSEGAAPMRLRRSASDAAGERTNDGKTLKIDTTQPASVAKGKGGKKGQKTLRVNQRVESLAEAAKLAKAHLRKANQGEVQGHLELMGHPGLVAGITIELAGFGQFSGKWFVTKSTHKVGGSGGYSTSVEVRGAISKDAIKTAATPSVSVAPEATASGENAYARWEAAFNKTYNELYKSGSLTPKDELLLCLPAIAEAEARRAAGADRQGWLYLKAMFHKWFSGPANASAGSNAEPFWIDWDWVMSFERAQSAYEYFTNPAYGQSPYIINDAAKNSLKSILQRENFLTGQGKPFNFIPIHLWHEWDKKYHTQTIVERGWPPIDGLTAALGGFTLRALAAGKTVFINEKHMINVNKISVYARDAFAFEKPGDTLFYWNCAQKKYSLFPFAGASKLTHDDFTLFRTKYGVGNDFLVLSEPHQVETFTGISYD